MIRNSDKIREAVAAAVIGGVLSAVVGLGFAWILPLCAFAMAGLHVVQAFRDPPPPPADGDAEPLGVGA